MPLARSGPALSPIEVLALLHFSCAQHTDNDGRVCTPMASAAHGQQVTVDKSYFDALLRRFVDLPFSIRDS